MTPEKALLILLKNQVDANGKHIFKALGNPELLEALLVCGADANHFDTYFNVPVLSLAHSRQELSEFKLLLEHGANPDSPSSVFENREPIIFEVVSAQQGVDSFLRPMIKAGIDLNQLHPESGQTVLQHAASRYYVSGENLEFLIENGADPNLKNKHGQTLYDLIDTGEIKLHKPILLALRKHQTGYVEREITLDLFPKIENLNLDTHFYHSLDSFRGAKVLGKTSDTLTVRIYRTKQYDLDFPRTHTDALNIIFALLEQSKTPSAWKDAASVFDFQKYHVPVARQYIKSHIVSDFQLTYHGDLWEEKGYKSFDEIDSETLEKLQQATITITVNEPEMLETIEVGTKAKVPECNVQPLWYLENKATNQFFFLYMSNGGRWMAKEGEIGSDAKAKVIGGISKGYYKEANARAEAFAFQKFNDGFELVYKNFDTDYNLEDKVEAATRKAKINEDKNQDYSADAISAIKKKDVAKLAKILATGVNPDTLKDDYGNYAIEIVGETWYPEAAHLEMFNLLLNAGANPDKANYDQILAHNVAIRATNEFSDEMVKGLVKAGADLISVSDKIGESVLQCACRGGMLWFVEHLLENGADPNYTNQDEARTALHYALDAQRNAPEIIDLLLKYGADKNLLHTFYRFRNAFELAETVGTIEKLVEIGFDINMPNEHGNRAIYNAAEFGSTEMFAAFLRLGATFELYQLLYNITVKFRNNSQSDIERQIEKMRILRGLGHDLVSTSGDSPFVNLVDQNLKRRKKIAKWEEKALLDLWEMDCEPRRLSELNEVLDYLTKVDCQPMIEKVKERIAKIQAVLN